MGTKIFSAILLAILYVWVMAIANLTGCTPIEEDTYSCEALCDQDTELSF
jgi:hypothetical protein